jgi:hypothetical protein
MESDLTHVAVIDVGSPKKIGWYIEGRSSAQGTELDECVNVLAARAKAGPLALGFEAPLFVPARDDPTSLTRSRCGEGNRSFSAVAGAAALVCSLVVVRYVLAKLRWALPGAVATLDWQVSLNEPMQILFFEAFVTGQRQGRKNSHIEDAKLAVRAFQDCFSKGSTRSSAVYETPCVSLIGAMMLHTNWTADLSILRCPCLVIKGEE